MDIERAKRKRRNRRRRGIRKRIIGVPDQPRLAVYRSLKHIYAQVIDDLDGRTVVSASTLDKSLGLDKTGDTAAAAIVGKAVAERARDKGVERVAFDRGGFRYHGRIKALADAAREGGLKF